MMKNLKSVLVLTVICSVVATLMAATNALTAPVIKKNEAAAANEALLVVMPNGTDFEAVNISDYSLPQTVKEVYSEAAGGYVLTLETSGYSSGMIIMCGIDSEGAITGAVCLGSSETLGYEKEYGRSAIGKNIDTIDTLDTIGGATKTTGGYKSALKDALNAFVILQGGSVDLRTDEEILQDNLSAALPAGEGSFTEILITEVLTDVSGVFSADNGAGYVYNLRDESFIAVDKDGNIVGEADDDNISIVNTAHEKLTASTLTEIDISTLALANNILSIKRTSGGNYVFELRAAGFGINGPSSAYPSKEYIYISMAATPSGEIISIKTTDQHETRGYGAACADKSFYGQFVGKNSETYTEIDAISSATITTDGYKKAVGAALEAVKTLEGAR